MNATMILLISNFCLLFYATYLLLKKDNNKDHELLSATIFQLKAINFHIKEIDKEYKQITIELKKVSNNFSTVDKWCRQIAFDIEQTSNSCEEIKVDMIKLKPRRYTKKKEVK